MGKDKLPSEMDPKDLPDGRAFEDEFTRSLLQSTEEVLPGYYPFLAKNERWEMAFPKEGLLSEKQYITRDNFEAVIINDWKEGEEIATLIDIKYYSSFNPGFVEAKKDSLQSNMELPLTFEEVSEENQTYFIAPFEKELSGETYSKRSGYAAYVQKNEQAGGIFVIYSIYCESSCDELQDSSNLEMAYNLIKSINFLYG